MKRMWVKKIMAAVIGFIATAVFMLPVARAVSMSDYQWLPLFMQQAAPPNILFVVDFSDAMLPAAYGNYPVSFDGNALYSSNYAGTGLNVTASDVFNPSTTYFGMFDPLSCYTGGTSTFDTRVAKTDTNADSVVINETCGAGKWDGNFANWLAMRKTDLAKKVLIGGRTLSAANTDGTVNTLIGEPNINKDNVPTNNCSASNKPCYRYVKFVRASLLAGRFDTATYSAADTAWQSTAQFAGPGTVTTDGVSTTVIGLSTPADTDFNATFVVGDTITIGTPSQSRTIAAIAGDGLSLTVSSAFSPDLTQSTYSGVRTVQPGTVSVSNSSTTVTGAGTSFMTTFSVGDVIKVGTQQARKIIAIGGDTSLTVGANFTVAAAGQNYARYASQGNGPGTANHPASPATRVEGATGTTYTTTFAPGDVIFIGSAENEVLVIDAIATDVRMTVFNRPSGALAGTTYTVYKAASTALSGPGTVTTTGTAVANDPAGSGTTFLTTFQDGDQIKIGSEVHTVVSRASDSELTVNEKFSTFVNASYFNASVSLTGPGTVSTTLGSATITGVDTTFLTRFAGGEKIKIGSEVFTIVAPITSDTSLTVSVASAVTQSGATYNGPDGVFFGVGFGGGNTGTIFINGNGSPVPFDAASGRQLNIKVDITSETDAFKKTQSLGLLQNLRTDNMRVAVMFTNSDDGNAATVVREFDGNFGPNAFNEVRNEPPRQYAPLAESTYEALCYYRLVQGECYSDSTDHFKTAWLKGPGDPFFIQCLTRDADGDCISPLLEEMVSCCKSFILMISSGIPTGDGGTPNQQPFGNLLDTGVSNIGLTTSNSSLTADKTQLDDVALYGQTHDIRNDGTNSPVNATDPAVQTVADGGLPKIQPVTFYAVSAMGGASGASLLASAAKFGGFADQNGNKLPDAGSQVCTFPTGSSLGIGSSTSSAEWDTDKNCVPDTFFDASQGGDLATQINNAIASILKRAASGTSVSVLATSSTGEGAIYQAYFLPQVAKLDGTSNVVNWYGFTQGLFIDTFGNIREDSDRNGRLTLKTDQIVTLSFDTGTSTVSVKRCPDSDGDGKADSAAVPPCSNVLLSDIKPIWEAGARLAWLDPGDPDAECEVEQAGVSCRRILAWADLNNDHVVASSEVLQFRQANKGTLCPYLAGTKVADCNSTDSARQTTARTEAANLINFHRGDDGRTLCLVSGDPSTCLRDRSSQVLNPGSPNDTVGAQRVWKLGDVVDATPTVVAAPKERYDVIYGDTTYTTFLQQYKNRRQVAYVGANDGMLHAFNVGFFNQGDNPCTTTGDDPVEHGYFTVQPFHVNPPTASDCTFDPTARTGVPPIGAELWAFIPHALLPHLKWYADINYTHVAYMDLKPKVTDVRVFCDDDNPVEAPDCVAGQAGAVHKGGWGTILIAGMRFGGSCGACVSGATGGVPMTVTADFDGNAATADTTRTFYAMYFALDITDPEQDPVLLWSFTDARLGLTTSFPAVLRVSPVLEGGGDKIKPDNARWLAVFGTGPTGYTGISAQTARFFVVDIAKGPTYIAPDQTLGSVGQTSCSALVPCVVVDTAASGENVRVFATPDANSFMGDIITLDANLDFKVDVVYAGSIIKSTDPAYIGKMYRLTTGALKFTPVPPDTTRGTPESVASWGIGTAPSKVPTTLLADFSCSTSGCPGSNTVGPITAAATVSADTSNNIWVFFGSGRFFSQDDKGDTAPQYFFGVKDPCATSATCTQTTTSQQPNLLDVSDAVVCNPCDEGTTEVTNAGSNTSLGQLQDAVQNMDGWFTTLPTAGERSLSTPTILGGTVFFTTFIPTTDICVAAGSGNLYALYYLTGTAYKESAIGHVTGSTTDIAKSISLGTGLPSQMAVQIGSEGSGKSGEGGAGSGCAGRVTGFIQASTGVLGSVCGKPALSSWSRMLSWRDL
jgi:type IV pilus assembly protein PilY1